MNTIVLVHGAWADASAWAMVEPVLKSAGHEVIVLNLAGHGKDNADFGKIQLQTYIDDVRTAIGKRTEVILVGHSMAGMVISQTAEQIPTQIRKLIYVAAFLPRNGETLLQLATMPDNKNAELGKYLHPDEKTASAVVDRSGAIASFAADAPPQIQAIVLEHLKAEPLFPLVSPVTITDANFGAAMKTYIFTTDDKTVTFPLQQLMVNNAKVQKTYTLPSSHTPFLSMPGVLSSILLQEAK